MLTVIETHPCLIGESLAAGLPAMLVRLAGCNLDCAYCDTRYARTEPGEQIPVRELADRLVASGRRTVLLTGGEPLLQAPAVADLAQRLHAAGCTVLVETNGTLPISLVAPPAVRIVDVKTPGARTAAPFLEDNLRLLTPRDQLKLVLTREADYRWAVEFLRARTVPLDSGNILFSPAWGLLSPAALAGWMLRDRLPYRFHLQLHKVVWGERRGV